MIRVLDASVVVKWFVSEDTASTEKAADLLEQVLSNPRAFAVPELLFSECLHVFARRLKSQADMDWAMDHVFRLGLVPLRFDATVAKAATQAMAGGMTGYDATYFAFAKLVGGKWVTFDKAASAKALDKDLVELL
ncbi:MAG: hypothetical protein A2289_03400 [Deltaproteobacteria bacterium RIFOXYA12_FULL_58_15]|nr:MAG: hypothetical protein A2289_03400 [Deltaproteobacteria bacterium RIFOXYA12_FULL_58_15]OGR14232.1 MAG: hypothetical protein A2341_13495 [Deltaproteobacteria bacterium RIFOXYB12_FULL_58_9]